MGAIYLFYKIDIFIIKKFNNYMDEFIDDINLGDWRIESSFLTYFPDGKSIVIGWDGAIIIVVCSFVLSICIIYLLLIT